MIRLTEITKEAAAFRRRRALPDAVRSGALQAILDRRAIFVHVPKCGGKTVITNFYGLPQHDWFGHAKPGFYEALLGPSRYRDFFKFVLVRDPVDRCRSGFHFAQAGGFGTQREQAFGRELSALSFEAFVLDGHLTRWIGRNVVFQPQHPFVADEDGVLLVDKLYRLERVCELFTDLGLDAEATSHENRADYEKRPVPADVAAAIRDVYRRDYEVLGFD
ncbi:MAG: Sulfotransferase family [Rhodobacteraceae bacterium HLUCCA08]|nr:MAG: Sulfotransferase family [Rhodobacteraceae bacterium HLUCCA08]